MGIIRDVMNGLDFMFDWNHDGMIDHLEEHEQQEYIAASKDPLGLNRIFEEESDYDRVADEIEGMDAESAREWIESEGLDVSDFDDYFDDTDD